MGGRLTRVRAATVTGVSHREREEGGQDAVATLDLCDGRTVIAVADGAGSAPLSAEGSHDAVVTALDAIASGASIEDAFVAAAAALGDDPSERATTLLVVVIGDDVIEIGQVGDGHVVVRRCDGSYAIAGAVDADREYLNETTFLSSRRWRESLFLSTIPACDIDAVAVMTDGLQLVAVELATSTPHPGFFDPLFAWASSEDADERELASFLASPRLAERTDDDLTIALAVRPA